MNYNSIYLLNDNIGYAQLVDFNKSEEDISKIAGISHNSEKGPSVKDLLEWGHLSPFEFASVTFKVKAPIFVVRQWFRHRTGHYMEKSLRYCSAKSEFYIPEGLDPNKVLALTKSYSDSVDLYNELLKSGLPKEQARVVLPTALYTEFYFQMDLRNLIHFFDMRLDKHAQKEIREYSYAMLRLIEPLYPTIVHFIKKKNMSTKKLIFYGKRPSIADVSFLDFPSKEGFALTIFFSGCEHNCRNCQNPELQKIGKIYDEIEFEEFYSTLLQVANRLKTRKIVFQGGDPLFRQNNLVLKEVLRRLKEENYSTCIYTGYDYTEEVKESTKLADFVKCGKFREDLSIPSIKTEEFLQLASTNQAIYHHERLVTENGRYYFGK